MDRHELAAAMRFQGEWCARLGSPLYGVFFERIAMDLETGGGCWAVLAPLADTSRRSLLPLRFLAAVHRLVLEGTLPELARYYPSYSFAIDAGGGAADPRADVEGAWTAFKTALEQHGELIRNRVPTNVQTNEVGRCAAILPGFREIARETGLPLRLLEIGCSAGLNLRFDHILDCPEIRVVERRGCDLHPIELNEDGRLTLLSFVWPDQRERFRQLTRAIEIARRVPAVIEQADAIEWLGRQLRGRRRAWLSMEPDRERGVEEAAIDLTVWGSGERRGERRRIATAGYHGQNVVVL